MGNDGKKRFAVLLCAEDSDYVKKKYGGYFGVFVQMLAEEGETWDVYRVAAGDFPDDGDIAAYDGFVITGSFSDAHGDDLWIRDLLILLKKLNSFNKKVLGICFGHQLFASLKLPDLLSIIECHQDEVWELPPKAEVMAWSNKTGIEMFKYGDHIMGIQGHPEYTKDIILHLIDRLLHHNLIMESYADEVKANVENHEPHREAWKKLCISFLKGRLW
ncbi:hypothetical protein TEA_010287 [Camellia sinensis var. sinensis]|uniref:Uncharacterized protein n=1 Tax=Camellia sinensis var. sinensis TaxID=542762 RepID=A0A4S4E1Q0_CAMSN|nr:hypothetical protein TEA_010287 [Camellia sinensis var. sinensis]